MNLNFDFQTILHPTEITVAGQGKNIALPVYLANAVIIWKGLIPAEIIPGSPTKLLVGPTPSGSQR
jgi:hypothetical protein